MKSNCATWKNKGMKIKILLLLIFDLTKSPSSLEVERGRGFSTRGQGKYLVLDHGPSPVQPLQLPDRGRAGSSRLAPITAPHCTLNTQRRSLNRLHLPQLSLNSRTSTQGPRNTRLSSLARDNDEQLYIAWYSGPVHSRTVHCSTQKKCLCFKVRYLWGGNWKCDKIA